MRLSFFAIICSIFFSAVCCGQENSPEVINSIGMKLVLIPKGTFTMGSPESEPERFDIEVQHQVKLGKDFYLAAFEVTQAEYEKVMGVNPSFFKTEKVGEDSSKHPVEQVSWDDAVEFCKRLSELPEEKKAGRVYRLPTEAEWEYACRAGSPTAYSFGDDAKSLKDYAWFLENSGNHTHPVDQKKPNPIGLHGMHGNVWEWCSDYFGDYPKGTVTDPVGPKLGEARVTRGGGWVALASDCRSATRRRYAQSLQERYFGFRVAADLSTSGK